MSSPTSQPRLEIGIVVIGRNEGERLVRCLQSALGSGRTVIYVDSGSTDESTTKAVAMGAHLVDLDMSQPFTAARARNAGLQALLTLKPEAEFVQFVDGDCELVDGWLDIAAQFLVDDLSVGVVAGRLRERFPEASVYNQLCDAEWSTPVGDVKACGGIAMMRTAAVVGVGGFRDDLIAGEEPELCVRLRAAGSRVWRIDAEMALHDAAMTRFSQWWKRTMRGGYAFAEGASLHGASAERHWVTESRRGLLWGLVIPLVVVGTTSLTGPIGLVLLAVYPLQVIRLFLRESGSPRARALRASFLVLGKFAEAAGQLKYHALRVAGRGAALIEYK